MNTEFYLLRSLSDGEKTYTEAEVLGEKRVVIVLGEPGAGKTSLLKSLAKQLQANVLTANVLQHQPLSQTNIPLVVDALDELVKIGPSSVFALFGKISSIEPTTIILSSRSSEWEEAYTRHCKEFFCGDVLTVYLQALNYDEQQQIFEHHLPDENFEAFLQEISRFNLEGLLSNPQFLKIFADGYIGSGKQFIDKKSILKQAIGQLAKEENQNLVSARERLPVPRKIELAEQVFANLLLAGCEGVSTNQASAERLYPHLMQIDENEKIDDILATKLFKPSIKPNQHQPAHKIIAEYCAAQYLAQRINEAVNPLSLRQCLAMIAPNRVVRDELRGLAGWLATLGNQQVQESIIELDPYAVIANGDPSQLLPSSKKRLLLALQELAERNPGFRRGDYWRRFHAAGLFTADLADELKTLIMQKNEHFHLRILILELLQGSEAAARLEPELRQLVLSSNEGDYPRKLANKCLLKIPGYSYQQLLDSLIQEASTTSLAMVAESISEIGFSKFEKSYLVKFFQTCTNLYLDTGEPLNKVYGEKYFIKWLISHFDLDTTTLLLNTLTANLACKCGRRYYECRCRNGISKIVGSLLDRYFDLSVAPFNAQQVWQWVKNLHFRKSKNSKHSSSVRVLVEDDELRQNLIRLVFANETEEETIRKIIREQFGPYAHSGLTISQKDKWSIVNWAFETDNVVLWSCFFAGHSIYAEVKGKNDLRAHMRAQALEKSEFLRLWAKYNKGWKERQKSERYYDQKYNKKQRVIRNKNIQYIQENRAQIENGQNWGFLVKLAYVYLQEPNKLTEEFGDENIVKNILSNCQGVLESDVPDLEKLANIHYQSQFLQLEIVLKAVCVAIFRKTGSLTDINLKVLEVVRTSFESFFIIPEDDTEIIRFQKEVDRLVFSDLRKTELFLRKYIEPQLQHNYEHAQVSWLQHEEVFKPFQATLSLEWLERFPGIHFNSLEQLFKQAAKFGNRQQLIQLIEKRCTSLLNKLQDQSDKSELNEKSKFWLVQGFYFLENWEECWNVLKNDKQNVFLLKESLEAWASDEHFSVAEFSLAKKEAVLEAFVDDWPYADYPQGDWVGQREGADAFRFLVKIVQSIEHHNPDEALSVLARLRDTAKYQDFAFDLKVIYAVQLRKKALKDFTAPTSDEVTLFFKQQNIVTVEALRALVLDELQIYQNDLNGSETTSKSIFYNGDIHLGEVDATLLIADRLRLCLKPKNIVVTPEHQMQDAKRCDFTCAKVFDGTRKLLTVEVKGQWHSELFSAATDQLYQYYSKHPDAEQQGIYLILWFGPEEEIAGRKRKDITTPEQLKVEVEKNIPEQLRGQLDVFVLDVSKI